MHYSMWEKGEIPFISKLIIRDANRRWKKEGQQVMYKEYSAFERAYTQKHKMKREISYKHMPAPTERNACACLLYTYAARTD